MRKRIALITHDLSVGGLATMTRFLYSTLAETADYEPELISLATSASDTVSLQMTAPKTWFQGAKIEKVRMHDLVFTHAGVIGSEFEFQRYRPRPMLTELFRKYDLLQFVVGSPPWVCTAETAGRPVFVWTATTTRADRESQLKNGSLARRTWSSLMIPLTERYEKRGLQAANKVFALSEYTRAAVESIIPQQNVTLAPCGVDTHLFRPTTKARSDYIICVARFSDPRKNVHLLFEAYAMLQKKVDSPPDLYLVGDPPSEAAQLSLRRLGIAEKVHLVGPKQGEELAELYRNARFFVLSSNEEGLGIVVIEAMASGLAVVSTACGGPASAVVDGVNGFLTPVNDRFAMAAAMERLVRDPSLCDLMGRTGRQIAEERFSLSLTGNVFLDAYDHLLNGHRTIS